MGYCTQQDLDRRYGETEIRQLTERRHDIGTSPDEVLAAAIADADAEIEGNLSDGGYTVPLGSVPQTLLRHACAITRFYLYDDQRPEEVREDYLKAAQWLERVATRKIDLPGVDRPGSTVTGGTSVGTREQVYTDDVWESYE